MHCKTGSSQTNHLYLVTVLIRQFYSPSGVEAQTSLPCKGRVSICKCRVSQSTVFQLGNTKYVRLKVLSKGGSSQETINKACFFPSVFTSCELPLFPFFSVLFPFSCFRCCGLGANLICRLIFSHQSVQVLNKM